MFNRAFAALVVLLLAVTAVWATTSPDVERPRTTSVGAQPFLATKARSEGALQIAQSTGTCFLSGEKTDGLNKICFYRCTSGEAAITIKATSLCPLSIQR